MFNFLNKLFFPSEEKSTAEENEWDNEVYTYNTQLMSEKPDRNGNIFPKSVYMRCSPSGIMLNHGNLDNSEFFNQYRNGR